MYIDYFKDNYLEKSIEDREKYIKRDKAHLKSIIQTRITQDIENIVDRWYELDDIGLIEEDKEFLNLLKEAEELYSFGYFIGSISLIGVACEELCKFLIQKSNVTTNISSQYERINLLYKSKIVSKEVKGKLHSIRIIRNTYIHFNDGNVLKDENKLKDDSYSVIVKYKNILSNTIGSSKATSSDVFAKLISQQKISFNEFKYKNRNMEKRMNGLDLQISPDVTHKIFTSYYYIHEIDIEGEDFKEITLIDINNDLPVIVDLTIPQSNNIKELKLNAKNVIIATLISAITTIGQTEEWHLLNIHNIYRGEYNLD